MILELDLVKLYVSDWTKVSVGFQKGRNSKTTRTAVSGHPDCYIGLIHSIIPHVNTQLSDECIHCIMIFKTK